MNWKRSFIYIATVGLIILAGRWAGPPLMRWHIKRTLPEKIYVVLAKEYDPVTKRVVIQEFLHEDGATYYIFTSEKKMRKAVDSGLQYPIARFDRGFFLASLPENLKVWIDVRSRPPLKTDVATLRLIFPDLPNIEAPRTRYVPAEELKRSSTRHPGAPSGN